MDNVKVDGLVLSRAQYTRRDASIIDLMKHLNKNEETKIQIQLTSHILWNGAGDKKISSKLLTVKCAKEYIHELKGRVFSKLLNLPEHLLHSTTKHFKIFTFMATGAFEDKPFHSTKRLLTKNTLILQIFMHKKSKQFDE